MTQIAQPGTLVDREPLLAKRHGRGGSTDTTAHAAIALSWPIVCAISLVTWLVIRIVFFQGFEGSDDLNYVRFAVLWDRAPANHWEARLLGNLLIGASIRLFGLSEWSATLPALCSSLAIIGSVLFCMYRLGSPKAALYAGLLAAVVPVDVGGSTIVSPYSIMVGLVTVGIAAWLWAPQARWLMYLSAIALSLAVVTHLNAVHYVASLVIASLVLAPRRYLRGILVLSVAGIACVSLDLLANHIAFGDAFHRFRVCMTTHVESRDATPDTRLTLDMIIWAVRELVIGQGFGIAMLIAFVGAIIHWRCLSLPLRLLMLTGFMYWAWLQFGSFVPWAYRPFPHVVRYLHPFVLPVAVGFGYTLAAMSRRRLASMLAAISIVACLMILASRGPWGQSIEISRQWLGYLRTHPHQRVVADIHTLNELYILNGLQTPPNAVGLDHFSRKHFLDPHVPRIDETTAARCDAAVVNPLNLRDLPHYRAFIEDHAGQARMETAPRYRWICYIIPWLKGHPESKRQPSGSIRSLQSSGDVYHPPSTQAFESGY